MDARPNYVVNYPHVLHRGSYPRQTAWQGMACNGVPAVIRSVSFVPYRIPPYRTLPYNSTAQAKLVGLEAELESTRKRLSEAKRELAESRRDAKVKRGLTLVFAA